MADTIQAIGTRQQDPGVGGPDAMAPPPGGACSTERSARVEANAKYDAYASGGAAANACTGVAAPDHDFDRCPQEPIPNPVLFQRQAGDIDAVSSKDVQQRALGDCYLLASLAALACTPRGRALIRGAVVENKNARGVAVTWTVTLHQRESHLFGEATFRAVPVTIGEPYALGAARQRVENMQDEIWPLVVEKACAQYAGGYNAIGRGGVPTDAMALLTGCEAAYISLNWPNRWVRSYGGSELQADVASGKVIVLCSRAGIDAKVTSLPRGQQARSDSRALVGGHAYFVKGTEEHDGKLFARLGNPWGQKDPGPVPCDELAKWFSSVSVGSVP